VKLVTLGFGIDSVFGSALRPFKLMAAQAPLEHYEGLGMAIYVKTKFPGVVFAAESEIAFLCLAKAFLSEVNARLQFDNGDASIVGEDAKRLYAAARRIGEARRPIRVTAAMVKGCCRDLRAFAIHQHALIRFWEQHVRQLYRI
jgi:hypothetical protein